jgi:hypothetical protein
MKYNYLDLCCSICDKPFKKTVSSFNQQNRRSITKGIEYLPTCSRICRDVQQRQNKITLKYQVECSYCNSIKFVCKSRFNKSKSGLRFCNRICALTYYKENISVGCRRSKLEKYLEETIRQNYPNLLLMCNDKTAIGAELDFYFPDLKLAIELNGVFHFEPIHGNEKLQKTQKRDKLKFKLCQENNISLCVIDSSSCVYLSSQQKDKYWNIVDNIIGTQI